MIVLVDLNGMLIFSFQGKSEMRRILDDINRDLVKLNIFMTYSLSRMKAKVTVSLTCVKYLHIMKSDHEVS